MTTSSLDVAQLESSIRTTMEEAGQPPPPEFILNGKIHRYRPEGDRKGKNSWYVGYPDPPCNFLFGDWSVGTSHKFRPGMNGHPPTQEQQETWKKKEAEREAERRAEEEKAAELAQRIFESSSEANPDYPYLKKKNIKPYDARIVTRVQLGEIAPDLKIYGRGDLMVIPLRDVTGKLWSIQFITPDGDKIFLEVGRVAGLYFLIGEPKGKIIVCEGFSTGASIHDATGHTVACAMNAGNLLKVVKILREKFPDAEFTIAADHDKPARLTGIQAGEKFGKEAAFDNGALFAMPPTEGSDFNDVAAADGLDAVRKIIETATAILVDPRTKEKKPNSDSRPEIRIRGGALPEIVTQAENALIKFNKNIFQRGTSVVKVIRTRRAGTVGGVRRQAGTLGIHNFEPISMAEELTRYIRFFKYDGRKKDWMPTDCPMKISLSLLSRIGSFHFPPLEGIIEAPTLRADGSVLETPGYDKTTGLYLDTGGVEFPVIPKRPTKKNALDALDVLFELYRDFPFVAHEDRAVVYSAILTAMVRRSLPSAPLFGFDATTMGAGKTLLADTVSLIATGRSAAAMPQGENSEEDRKRLFALLLAGDQVVLVDNVSHPLGGDAFCSILTSEIFKDRVLGQSRTEEVSTGVVFMASGNNLTFIGDMTSRVVTCRIDPQVERPDERVFDRDLRAYIRENRPEIVTATLVILRAYHIAGRPTDLPPWGRFEVWGRWIRGALVWLGESDPCKTRLGVEDNDPVKILLRIMLKEMAATHPDGATASNLIDELETRKSEKGMKLLPIHRALEEAGTNQRGKLSTRSLGWWFRRFKNRIVDGHRLVEDGKDHSGAIIWKVETNG